MSECGVVEMVTKPGGRFGSVVQSPLPIAAPLLFFLFGGSALGGGGRTFEATATVRARSFAFLQEMVAILVSLGAMRTRSLSHECPGSLPSTTTNLLPAICLSTRGPN